MKKIILTTFILVAAVFSFEKSVAKQCFGHFNVGGTDHIAPFYNLSIAADTLFDVGTTINLPITISVVNQGMCFCTPDSTWCTYNGGIISNSQAFNVMDTGTYLIYYNVAGDLYCDFSMYNFQLTLHVGYRTSTSVSEISNPDLFQIYPTISKGICKIKTDPKNHIKKIAMSDEAGRIVFTSSTDFSEINLGAFAQGIYFYAAEDDEGNVFRGKLIRD